MVSSGLCYRNSHLMGLKIIIPANLIFIKGKTPEQLKFQKNNLAKSYLITKG